MSFLDLFGETANEALSEVSGGCMAGIFLLSFYYWIRGKFINQEISIWGLIFLVFAFPVSIIIILFLRENLFGLHYNGMLLGFIVGALAMKLLFHRSKETKTKTQH